MGAPSGAYRNQAVHARNAAGTLTVTHLCAIMHTNKATMLARFYLDDIFIARMLDGTDGVIGIINTNSTNYQFHTAARRGCLRKGSFGVFCNDGGLNTLGFCTDMSLIIPMKLSSLGLSAYFRSAYYSSTSDHGFAVTKNGVTTKYSIGTLAAATDRAYNANPSGGAIQVGDYLTVRAYIVNEEGEFQSPNAMSFYVRPDKYQILTNVVHNGGDQWAFQAFLYAEDGSTPVTLEVNLTVVIKQYYYEFSGASLSEAYVTVQIDAGQTAGETIITLGVDFGNDPGTIEMANHELYSNSPVVTSDNIPIVAYTPTSAPKWYVLFSGGNVGGNEYGYTVTLYDNDQVTPITLTDDLSFIIRQPYQEHIGGATTYIDVPLTIFAGNNSAADSRFAGADFGEDPGEMIVWPSYVLNFTPLNVDGREIVIM